MVSGNMAKTEYDGDCEVRDMILFGFRAGNML